MNPSQDQFNPTQPPTNSELRQADLLEQYLTNLAQGKIEPIQELEDDVLRTARHLAIAKTVTPKLAMPTAQSKQSRRLWLWLIPLPLVAITGVIGFILLKPLNIANNTTTDATELATELDEIDSTIDDTNTELLALENDLNNALDEIDALSSTDYIDNL